MSCLQTTEESVGPFYFRPSGTLRAGAVCRGHQHKFDHVTLVLDGSIRIRETHPDGREAEVVVPRKGRYLTRAEVCHEITALEDGTEYECWYTHRDPETGEVVQEANRNWSAYR